MLSINLLQKLFDAQDFTRIVRALAGNGAPMPLPLQARLSFPTAATALALRRAVELTYGPTSLSRSLTAHLLHLQRPDGAFPGPMLKPRPRKVTSSSPMASASEPSGSASPCIPHAGPEKPASAGAEGPGRTPHTLGTPSPTGAPAMPTPDADPIEPARDPLATACAVAGLSALLDEPAHHADPQIEWARDRALAALADDQGDDGLFSGPTAGDRTWQDRAQTSAFILALLAPNESFRAAIRYADLLTWFEENEHRLEDATIALLDLARAETPKPLHPSRALAAIAA